MNTELKLTPYKFMYKSSLSGYNPKEIDNIQDSAWMNLSRTKMPEHKMMPHCLILTFGTHDIFSLTPEHKWEMEIYIFDSNNQLESFTKQYGEDKIYDSIFV